MFTRSKSRILAMQDQPKYPTTSDIDCYHIDQLPTITIDFDEASEAWKANKKYIGNGCYKYKCSAYTKNKNPCKNIAFGTETTCKKHMGK